MIRVALRFALTVNPYSSLLYLFKNNTIYQINSKNMQEKNPHFKTANWIKNCSIQVVHKLGGIKKKGKCPELPV